MLVRMKKIDPERRRVAHNFKLPPDLVARLRERSAKTGLCKTRIVEFALMAYLEKHP